MPSRAVAIPVVMEAAEWASAPGGFGRNLASKGYLLIVFLGQFFHHRCVKATSQGFFQQPLADGHGIIHNRVTVDIYDDVMLLCLEELFALCD